MIYFILVSGGKMKKKYYFIIIGFILFLISIITIIFILINNINKDKQKLNKKQEQINQEYNAFSNKTEDFKEIRNKFLTSLNENNFYETFSEVYVMLINNLENYEQVLDDIKSNSTNLVNNCQIVYNNSNTNKKCEAFNYNYNTLTKTFLSDVEIFNKKIEEYNNWAINNNQSPLDKYNANSEV